MIIFAALALSFFPQIDEQNSQPDKPEIDISLGCKRCGFMGAKDCKSHSKLFTAEQEVNYCWVAAQCKKCSGSLLVDCAGCESGPLFEKRQSQLKVIEGFANSNTEPSVLLDRELPRIITDHFDFCVTAKKMKNGSKSYNTHELMHAMAADCEASATLFDKHYQAELADYSNRARIWYWFENSDHQEVCLEILGGSGGSNLRYYGIHPAVSSFSGDEGLKNDALDVIHNAIHVSIHLILSSVHKVAWIGDEKAGWFDVGAAHWYEEKLFARVATYCIDEANEGADYEDGQWRVAMKKHLRKNKDHILPKLTQLTTHVLEEEQHALAWSLYDYVVANHPLKLKPLLMGYKDGIESRDLFKEHLEMNIMQVENAWRAWVADTYPSKDLKPRKKV